MILVTLGTHEQGFDRLVEEIDRLKGSGQIESDVFVQGVLNRYIPKHCDHKEMLDYEALCKMVSEAQLVITHGGPGSIMLSISYGKIPIVVPRMHKFGEHVDDHQVRFVKKLEDQNRILAVYDIEKLKEKIRNYHVLIRDCTLTSPGIDKSSLIRKLEEYCSYLLSIHFKPRCI